MASTESQASVSSEAAKAVNIGWVLRDMMQSTGVWTFDQAALSLMVKQALAVGFSSLEIGGGQSYQIALEHGFNPYQVIQNAKCVINAEGARLPLQILMRGANQLGFQHYATDVQQQSIDLLVDAGGDSEKNNTLIIRNFDALNDAENLRFSISYMVKKDQQAAAANALANSKGQPALAKRVHVQAALSYVQPANNSSTACYSSTYYVNYAKKLIAIAEQAGGGLDSLCIKDMSGQLTPALALDLIPALKSLGLPVYLHCHSTDEARALGVQTVAIEAGISGIEVAVEPLAGGASHHDVENICYLKGVIPTNAKAITALKANLAEVFGSRAQSRQDAAIPLVTLKKLVSLGIPGGAIPFIVKDLQANVCGMFGVDLDEALVLFEDELRRIQSQLGFVPLVTPTADIIAKQTIKSLGNRQRTAAYQLVDPRFCRLVLGHYGQVVNHATDERVDVAAELVEEVKQYCASIEQDADGFRSKAGRIFPEPSVLAEHPATIAIDHDVAGVEEYVGDLFSRYPQSCENFGTVQECVMMHIMRPAGKTDRLLTKNILQPTEDRLRFILDQTLHLLPGKDIPESRQVAADELTDEFLLAALGDYDGIVNSIKDLVLNGDKESIRLRINQRMIEVIDPICQTNDDARKNRYYIERRFVGLFAGAVFWDLQRICRRTGADSRASLDEMTARKLDRIISTTLKRRRREGVGQAQDFLS